MLRLLIITALLLTACVAAHADGWQDRLGAAVVCAPNDGGFLGVVLSYQVHDHLWADGVFRRDGGGTAEGLGASTDAQAIADLISRVLGVPLPVIPPRARVGATVVGDKFGYVAYGVDF